MAMSHPAGTKEIPFVDLMCSEYHKTESDRKVEGAIKAYVNKHFPEQEM
jgi:hypothetical protein